MSRWWEHTSEQDPGREGLGRTRGAPAEGEPDLLYIDLHLLHEVTSPQAFDGLRLAGRPVRRPDLTLATEDHNTPTDNLLTIADPVSRTQIETLRRNCAEFGVRLHPLGDAQQGIVHVIGPQLGLTQPGMTIVCGDSHTATHGAFGALAFGIGTSEVEHVLATQTLPQARPKTMAVNVIGELPPGVTAKDLVLALITQVGTGGGRGHVVEYRGPAIEKLSMEGRMTISNMSIEWGAKAGLIAPDETTFAYLKGRQYAPKGADWDAAVAYWRTLPTDAGAALRHRGAPRRERAHAVRHLGHQPGPGRAAATPWSPTRRSSPTEAERAAARRALEYMDLTPGHAAARHRRRRGLRRLLHQRPAGGPARRGRRAARAARWPTAYGCWWCPVRPRCARRPRPRAWTRSSPTAGAEWRFAGCSMCLGMNPDTLKPGERSASTSNRNFEGRQGRGGRTHLVSPAGRRRHRRRRPPGRSRRPGPVGAR